MLQASALEAMVHRSDRGAVSACIFPLFNWFLVSDETFAKFDCRLFNEEGKKSKKTDHNESVGDILQYVTSNEKIIFSSRKQPQNFSKVVTETFSRAGVNSNIQKIGFKTDAAEVLITPVLTLRMLDQEVLRKEIAAEVLKKRAHTDAMLNVSSGRPDHHAHAVPQHRQSSTGIHGEASIHTQLTEDTESSSKKNSESVGDRLASLSSIIALRKKVIDKNNNLCLTEKFIRDKKRILKDKLKQSPMVESRSIPTIRNASAARPPASVLQEGDEEIGDVVIDKDIRYAVALSANRPEDPYILQRAMSVQQYDMLESLSELQTIKTMKQAQAKKIAKNAGSTGARDHPRVASAPKNVRALDISKKTFSLASKLEVLEELLENSRTGSSLLRDTLSPGASP